MKEITIMIEIMITLNAMTDMAMGNMTVDINNVDASQRPALGAVMLTQVFFN